jgi:hypothetical protein
MKNIARQIIGAIAFCSALTGAHAQQAAAAAPSTAEDASTAAWKTSILGPWVITSPGDNRFATLMIRGLTPNADGFQLDALTGGNAVPAAAVVPRDGVRTMELTLASGMKFSVKQVSDVLFEGTATAASGEVRPAQVRSLLAKPDAAVPAGCAAFHGGWGGIWGQGVGATRLWVLGEDASCNVYYSYQSTTSDDVPATYRKGTIKDNTLAVGCGTSGTCVFTQKGDQVWATYTSTSGNNTAVFRRVSR